MCQDAGPWPGGFSTSLFTSTELSHHGTWKPSQGSGLWLITPLSVMAVRPRSAVFRGQPAPGLRGEGGEDAGPGYFFAHPHLGSDLGLVAFIWDWSLRSSPPKKKNHLSVLPGIAIPRRPWCCRLGFLSSSSSPGWSQLHPGDSLNTQPLSSPCRLPWPEPPPIQGCGGRAGGMPCRSISAAASVTSDAFRFGCSSSGVSPWAIASNSTPTPAASPAHSLP